MQVVAEELKSESPKTPSRGKPLTSADFDDPIDLLREQIRQFPMESLTTAFVIGSVAASPKARALALSAAGRWWDRMIDRILPFDLNNHSNDSKDA